MNKAALVCGMLLTLFAASADAAGLNLRWNACLGDGGVQNRTSACTSNVGSNVAVGSFVLPRDVTPASGIECVVDIATAGTALPAWWTTACRPGFINANSTISVSALNCAEWTTGAAGGLASYSQGTYYGPSSARCLMGFAVPAPGVNVFADAGAGPQEYFAFNLTISNTKTTGTGSCAGCSTPACLQFNNLKVASGTTYPVNMSATAATSAGFSASYITWQGGAGVSSTLGGGCPAAVPTHKATWTSVKSLYR